MSPKKLEQTAAITFRVTPELRARVMTLAEERGDNVSELLRQALENYVREGTQR